MSVYVDYNARDRMMQQEAAAKKQQAAQTQPALAMLAAAAAQGSGSSAAAPPAASASARSSNALSASARPFNPEDLGPSVYRPPSQQLYNLQPQSNPASAPAAASAASASASAASDMQAYLRAQHLALHGTPQHAAAPVAHMHTQQKSQPSQQPQQQRANQRPNQRAQQRAPQPAPAAAPQVQSQSQSQQQSQQPSQQQSQQQSRPPRGQQQQQQQQQQQASQPSFNQPAQRGISSNASSEAASSNQRGRGGRNNRGGGRGAAAAPASASSSSSSAAAPASAASVPSSSSSSSSSGAPSARGVVRDQAWREGHADNSLLAKSITEQLMTNSYDCSICSEPVGRTTKIWSCDQCHIILHLKCIKRWFETNRAQSLGDTSFRCPGCMFVRVEPPGDYVCFCGKQVEPDPSPFLTPHACSSPCGKPRNCGVHACNLPCHPGFCPKCTIPGPMSTCACGATQRATKCGEESAEKATCDGVCGKPLSCGVQTHTCERKCHNGPCDPCADTQQLKCFCGQVEEARVCGQAGTVVDPQHPERKSFSCVRICNRALDCGEHRCKDVCHAGPCSPCARQPPSADAQLQKCACGKVAHTKQEITAAGDKLAGWARSSCKDTLPTCGAKCGRLLNCNWHLCSLPCHDFDSVPCGMVAPASSSSSSSSRVQPPSVGCSEVVKRQCRCAAQNIVEVPCTHIRGDSSKGIPPASQLDVRCDTKCRVKLACKKHQCGQICCPRGESHVCVKVCGKPLGCGKHNCDAFCHIGSCQPCGVVYRDGITCACGRTSTGRNTKCGTALPHCPYPCTRQRACDPSHHCIQTCHENACAPCVVLTNKMCAGGHKELKSIPCYASPSCGITCNRILRCGIHTCKKPCHAGKCTVALGSQMGERKGWSISPAAALVERKEEDAEEEDDGSIKSCLQKCGQKRSDCGHPCGAKCHPGEACPTDAPCKESVRIYCDCKRISKVVPCSVEGGGVSLRALSCTAQCEVETRNARFRDALQLDDSVPRIPYPSELLDQVIAADLFEFVVRMERMLAEFLGLTYSSSKTFAAMPTAQRWVLHQLASYYNLDSESFDPEPRRAVRVIKTALTAPPKMKLSDAVKLYREAKAGKGGLTTSKVTLAPSTVIHVFDLDADPRISPSDLNLALRPYALDYSGERNNNFRVNFMDHSHALIVFTDAQLASNVRANLVQRKLFAAEPDEGASQKAVAAWRTNYQHNGLFRRHHETGGVSSLKKLSAAAPISASSFDDWSSARSKAAEPAPAAASSSWDSAPLSSSDHASDAEFEAVLERSRLEALASNSSSAAASSAAAPSSAASASSSFSTSASSSSTAGSVSFSQPQIVSTTNKFVALHGEDDDEEEEEEVDGAAEKTTRKQRRRAAAAAAASSGADGSSSSPDAWEELASKKALRKASEDVPAASAARSAFDD